MNNDIKIKIICVFHKECKIDKRISDNNIYIPIFGGKILYTGNSSDISMMLGDNSGDNISEYNKYINEITCIYWVWKHYLEIGNPEFIGLNHYRRFLVWNYSDLSENTILAHRIDLKNTIYNQNALGFFKQDIDVFSEYLKKYVFESKNDICIWKNYLNEKWFYNCNMFIMPKHVFFNYMTFMEKCINVCIKMIKNNVLDLSNRDLYQKRVYGFLLERMTGFFLYMFVKQNNKYIIKNTQQICIDC